MKNKCLCGRATTKKFQINKKEICLCPYCAYEILIQTAIYNFSEEYMKDLNKAIRNRFKISKKGIIILDTDDPKKIKKFKKEFIKRSKK